MKPVAIMMLGGAVALVAWYSIAPTYTPEAGWEKAGAVSGATRAAATEWRVEIRAARLKFAEWHTLATDDAAGQARFAREVVALLTDANTAAFARSLNVEEANTAVGLAVLERWLRLDPRAAADWVAGRGEGTDVEALAIARAWSGDARALNAYCDALADSEWKQVFLKTAGLAAVARDPVAALALADRMDEGAERANVRQTAAYDWMTRDPIAATRWIEGAADPAERESLRGLAAKAIAVTDPELAARWLTLAVKGEGEFRDQALCIVESWASLDPSQAAAWVARFPAQAGRDAAIDAVVRAWAKVDPAAADAWVDTLQDRAQVLARSEARRQVSEADDAN